MLEYRDITPGSRVWGLGILEKMMENQMEKQMAHDMESGVMRDMQGLGLRISHLWFASLEEQSLIPQGV